MSEEQAGTGPYEGMTWDGKEWSGARTPEAMALWSATQGLPAAVDQQVTAPLDQPPIGSTWDGTHWVAPPAPAPTSQGSNVALWIIVGLLAIIAAPFALTMLAVTGVGESLDQFTRGAQGLIDMLVDVPGIWFTGAMIVGLLILLARRSSFPLWAVGIVVMGLSVYPFLQVAQAAHYVQSRGASFRAAGIALLVAGAVLLVVGIVQARHRRNS